MDDIKLAMLGNKDAAKRLTEAGAMVPCCCGREAHIKKRDKIIAYKVCCESISCGNETMRWPDKGTAIRVWNTRAPILSESELKKLEEKA